MPLFRKTFRVAWYVTRCNVRVNVSVTSNSKNFVNCPEREITMVMTVQAVHIVRIKGCIMQLLKHLYSGTGFKFICLLRESRVQFQQFLEFRVFLSVLDRHFHSNFQHQLAMMVIFFHLHYMLMVCWLVQSGIKTKYNKRAIPTAEIITIWIAIHKPGFFGRVHTGQQIASPNVTSRYRLAVVIKWCVCS